MKYAFANGFMVSLAEVILGVAIILGWRITQTLLLSIAMFVFFGFLTFYSAYFNKVTDCGCFGDAIHFTPWQSFGKDMFLLAMTMFLWFKRKHITSKQYAILVEMVFIVIGSSLAYYSINNLPIIDFRPYNIGANIQESMIIPDDAEKDIYEDIWYYKVEGEVKEFSTDDAPWDINGSEFVDRKTNLISKGYEPPIHDFSLEKNGEDFTSEILSRDNVLCLVSLNLNDIEEEKFTEFKRIISDNDNTIIITSSSNSEIDIFLNQIKTTPEIFIIDNITCKTIVRANPGVLRLKKGVIVEKFAL